MRPASPIPVSKHLMDVALSALALVLLAPLMLVIALAIKLTSRGPVFYVALRAGYRGQPFALLKFRTMRVGSDRQGAITAAGDQRVIPVGKLLRLLHLDELPQLFNVLHGDMSLVGPRPEDLDIVRECYSAEQREVMNALPGLTGIPQVRFFPDIAMLDPGSSDPQRYYREVILPVRLEMDLEYVRRRSFGFDLRLLAATLFLIAFKSWMYLLPGFRAKHVTLSLSREAEGTGR